MALKFGTYIPSTSVVPFTWFYVGANVWTEENSKHHTHPWGLELGLTAEPVYESVNVQGLSGRTVVWKPAGLGGMRIAMNPSIDFSFGIKYRDQADVYTALSWKFNAP